MLIIGLALTAASVSEQMAPARHGLEQCQMPDAVSKVCYSLSKVVQDGPSKYSFKTEIVVDSATSTIGMITAPAFVDGSRLCEVMKAGGTDAMTFKRDGNPLSPAETAQIRAQMGKGYATLAGRKICTEIVPNDDSTLRVIATVDGRRTPSLDYLMTWVSRSDGWRVAP